MLQTRLKTAALLLPAVLAIVVLAPAPVFTGFIGTITIWGLYEVGAMLPDATSHAGLLGLCGAGSLAMLVISGAPSSWIVTGLVAATGAGMLGLVVRVGSRGPDSVAPSAGLVLLGGLAVGLLFPYFAFLRNAGHGIEHIVMALALVVASDSGAYFAGRSLGRVKLLPKVSPQKTVEGAVGGLVTCIAAGLILRERLTSELTPSRTVVLALGVATLAQLGDLANSALKRVAGVKDSGWIFPGHGGLLDRTCSLVFPVVFAYYYLH